MTRADSGRQVRGARWNVVADDPAVAHKRFAERLRMTDKPRHRLMLETFLEHCRAEADFDLDGTMATLVADPQFTWGVGGDITLTGYEAVRAMYADLFAIGGIANWRGEVEEIVIDDATIFFHSRVAVIAPWSRAKEAGYAIADERGHYSTYTRCAVILSFDEVGLMLGEKAYVVSDPGDFEPVPDAELSAGYRAWLTRFAVDS